MNIANIKGIKIGVINNNPSTHQYMIDVFQQNGFEFLGTRLDILPNGKEITVLEFLDPIDLDDYYGEKFLNMFPEFKEDEKGKERICPLSIEIKE